MKSVKIISLSTILFSLCFGLHTQAEMISGIVYNDVNRNGIPDKNEKGVSNVPVSNGASVVLTDKKGRYHIDIEANEVLFITKPSGYKIPQDENNVPRFFYIHSPYGTPMDINLRYPGLMPSGEIKGDINFPIYRYKEQDDYDVILVSDPQTGTKEELGFFRDRIVTEFAFSKAAFGITAGDIVFDDLSLFPVYRDIMAQVGTPWFNLAGNHDINYLAPDDVRSLDTFKRYFGPSYYSFDWGKAHYIILDTVFYMGTDPAKRNSAGEYIAKLDAKQLNWLKSDLSHVPKEKLVVLAMHIPIDSINESSHGGPLVNRKEILELLSGFKNVFAVAGHLHTAQHRYFGAEDGYNGKKPLHLHILTTASGTWWSGVKDISLIPHTTQLDGTPNGYHVMSIRGINYSIQYRAAGKPFDYQMRISIEKMLEKEVYSSIPESMIMNLQIVVNLFDGGERSTVSCQVDNGEPFFLTKEARTDTFAFKSYEKANLFISGTEFPSTHIWTGTFKDILNPGVHKIIIKAVDEYGKEHHGIRIFNVVDDKKGRSGG